jgi:hypothetical protein
MTEALMRRGTRAAALAATAAVLALIFASAAAESKRTGDEFKIEVVASTRGPLPACHTSDCTASTVWYFVYVTNKNKLGDVAGHTANRTTLPNAFVVNDVQERIFVDGELISDSSFTPPPNVNFLSYSGHWPSTVRCPPGGPPPCTIVLDPAVIPGETASVVYLGWNHAAGEPNGTYVFTFTVHGSVNGEPVDLSITSHEIVMTD